MNKDDVIRFVKEQYEDFVPVWEWKVAPEKKKPNQRHFNQVLEFCRMSQYFVAAFAILCTLSFEGARTMFVSAALRDGILLVLMELSTFIFLGYFMGLKRFPANYISLVIIKSFVVLERSYKPEVENFELKVLENSRFHGQWSLLSYKPNPQIHVTPIESHVRNLCLMFTMIAAVWAISKYSEIDVSRQEKCALITTTVSTSVAALLLISTFAFKEFPEIIPAHKRWCEIWLIFSVSTFVFILIFLLQRVRLLLSGRLKPSHNLRMQWECVLFMLGMYIMTRYIPVIHKGVQVRSVLNHKSAHLTHFLVPEVVQDSSRLLGMYFYAIGKHFADIYAKLLKK